MPTYIDFDTRSGQILSVHHGSGAEGAARHTALHQARRRTPVEAENVRELAVAAEYFEPGKRYRVDPRSGTLVADQAGVGFSFGSVGRGRPGKA